MTFKYIQYKEVTKFSSDAIKSYNVFKEHESESI